MQVEDKATVSFPASADFARVGRVTAAGLALRLGFDVGTVENLRSAVDTSVRALIGSGTITINASWTDHHLELNIINPSAQLLSLREGLTSELSELVPHAEVSVSSISLEITAV